jgi:hypothetical protein
LTIGPAHSRGRGASTRRGAADEQRGHDRGAPDADPPPRGRDRRRPRRRRPPASVSSAPDGRYSRHSAIATR